MARHVERDLREALLWLKQKQPAAYSVWLDALREAFGKSERHAKGLIAVLARAGYAEAGSAEEFGLEHEAPRGRVFYRLSERGTWLFENPTQAPTALRVAHRLYTTSPSPRQRYYQQAVERRPGGRHYALMEVEDKLNIEATIDRQISALAAAAR
jgi:hypothetical protein